MNPVQQQFHSSVRSALSKERLVVNEPGLISAAVLVPIVFRDGVAHLILTRRTMTVASHKGQIAFPGGVTEPCDKDEIDTALREANEEIGLDPILVEPVGLLDDFTTVSGFRVTPVVGFVDENASFTADSDEVDELFEVPLHAFEDPTVHELVTVEMDGMPQQYHSYEIGAYLIWGATAGIINTLLLQLAPRMESVAAGTN